MARKNKKATQAKQPGMFDGAEASDDLLRVNHAAPAQALHESRGRRRRALVWTFIIVGVFSTLAALNLALNPAPVPEQESTSSTEVNFSAGKSAAQARVAAWLAQDPSPLPGGYVVSWDGFDLIEGGVPKNENDNPANAAELHYFTLATLAGGKTVFYDATALVSISDELGAIAAAEPTLMPRVPAATQGWSSQVWPGYETAALPDAAVQSVTAWAAAFTGTADALRLYLGDEDSSHSYMPLSGARVIAAAIPSAGYIKVEGVETPKVIIARVELTIAWSSAPDAKGSKVMYDVRIEQAHTASPKIVAWGPAGTGPALVKFGNAVTGKVLSNSTDPAPSVTPAPAPTSSEPATLDDPAVVSGPGHEGDE